MRPKDISVNKTGLQLASFSYYEGIKAAKSRKLKWTSSAKELIAGTHYMVMCGDVMFKVTEEDYPEVKRQTL